MAEQAGSLSFGFEADFSGFTRAAETAGGTLDRLAGRADAFAATTSAGLARSFDTAAALEAKQAALLRTLPPSGRRAGRPHHRRGAGGPQHPRHVGGPGRQCREGA